MVYLTRPASEGSTPSSQPHEADPHTATRERAVGLALLSTIVALVVVAVLYAVLADGPDTSGAAHLRIIVYGTTFALAIPSMFHTIGLLASSSKHIRDVVIATRLWTSVVGPTIALVLVSSAALDVFYFRCGHNCAAWTQLGVTKPFGLGMILTAFLLAASTATFLVASKRPVSSQLWQAVPAILVVAVALLAACVAMLLLMLPANLVPADGLVAAVLGTAFALFLACYPRHISRSFLDRLEVIDGSLGRYA